VMNTIQLCRSTLLAFALLSGCYDSGGPADAARPARRVPLPPEIANLAPETRLADLTAAEFAAMCQWFNDEMGGDSVTCAPDGRESGYWYVDVCIRSQPAYDTPECPANLGDAVDCIAVKSSACRAGTDELHPGCARARECAPVTD
jgi:hypothetical protein